MESYHKYCGDVEVTPRMFESCSNMLRDRQVRERRRCSNDCQERDSNAFEKRSIVDGVHNCRPLHLPYTRLGPRPQVMAVPFQANLGLITRVLGTRSGRPGAEPAVRSVTLPDRESHRRNAVSGRWGKRSTKDLLSTAKATTLQSSLPLFSFSRPPGPTPSVLPWNTLSRPST